MDERGEGGRQPAPLQCAEVARERQPPGNSLSFGSKRKNQRKLPLFRRSGPATKGLHAPWNPKAEVAECAGYANAVLLFALNARALCSDLKFGCSPEPPMFLTAAL